MKINFITKRKYWYILSGLVLSCGIVALVVWGLVPSIDFTGGSLLEVKFLQVQPSVEQLKQDLLPLDYGNINIQPVEGDSFIFRLPDLSESEHQELLQVLKINYSELPPDQAASLELNQVIDELRFESIGPIIGQELKNKSVVAIILTLIFIIIYIAYAFRKVSYPVASWKYGVIAIIALLHDVLFLLGLFAILGHFMNYEVDILFITALLTTLGYSVHDTIVVFDRTRENLFHKQSEDFDQVVNESVNQTLARSINTSFTTLLVMLSVYLFGGATINHFILALMAGTVVGTYSSIFIASPLLVDWFKIGSKNR